MSYNPLNPNGQATMANSEPVVIASNQSPVSVAGTVNVGNLPTTQNVSGSVVAFQGTSPFIITGSVQGGGVANQSVSGTVQVGNFPTNQNVSGSVVAFQAGTQSTSISGQVTVTSSIAGGIFPISGSVAAVVTNFPTTQNVSGSVVAQQIGTRITSVSGQVTVVSSLAGGIFPVSGSVAAVVTNTPNVNAAGSVVAFQGTSPWINTHNNNSVITVGQGSIAAVIVGGSIAVAPAANQSVSGTVQTDVRGSVATVIIGGSIAASFTPPANQSVSGEVNVVQTTNPWIITGSVQASISPAANQSVSGTVGASVIGHAPVVIVGGSILTSSTPNQSVSGTVGASIIGLTPFKLSDGAEILDVYEENQVDASVTGTAIMFKSNMSSSIMSTVSPANPLPTSVQGTVAVSNTNLNVGGSVVAFQGAGWSGSVAAVITGGIQSVALAGANTVSIVGNVGQIGTVITSISGQVTVVSSISGGIFPISGSVAATVTNTNLNVGGSVIAFQGGTIITSISGIPQASVHGTVQIFPASLLSGHGSVNGAASVQILAAPGTGLYNYVTDILLSNTGAATTLVTITDGDGSVMGKSIAPAGGGAVVTAITSPMRTLQTNKVVNISAATATSVLHAWIGGYKAP